MRITLFVSAFVALMLNSGRAQAQQYLDCSCLATQAVLVTNACRAVVPDLCQFTNCYRSSVQPPIPLSCSQSPPAGTSVGPGTTPITVTVMDPNGVSSQCVVNFQVNSVSTGPFSLVCASNKTVLCDLPWSFDPPTPTNYCCPPAGVPNNGITLVSVITSTNGTCPAVITRTWTARDACDKVATCSQSVTVIDIMPPLITCAPNQTLQCGATWVFGTPVAVDNCTASSNLSFNIISTTTNFGCGDTYTASQVWMVHDLCGNASYCTQTVAVVDTTPPTIVCGATKTVECRTQWSFDTPAVFDNCSVPGVVPTNITLSIVSTVTNGTCPRIATQIWQAIDACGNSSQCTQTVTIVDSTPPVLDCNCLRSQVALQVVGCSNTIPDLCAVSAKCATDNCGPLTCTQTPAAGTVVGPGTYPITVTVYDCASNAASCVLNFTVTPPSSGCIFCTNVVDVFNTGMGGPSGNVLLPAGTPDPNYTLVVAPAGCNLAQVIDTNTMPAPPWVGTGPNSQWIGGGLNAVCAQGFYLYRLAINVQCATNSTISGQWTADDFAEVFLNGQPTGLTAPSTNYPYSFTGWHPLLLTNGFVCGTNYIDFYVTNAWASPNPTGFRAEITNIYNSCCSCTNPPTNCAISIRCPTNITVTTCSSNAVVFYPTPLVINPCNSNLTLICNPPSGSTFPVGTNGVTCLVGNAGAILAQCSFLVIVQGNQCDFVNGNFAQQVPANGSGGGWFASGNFGGAGWDPSEGNPAPSYLLNNVGDPNTDPTISQRLCCFHPGQCYTIRGQRKVQAWFGNTNLSFAVLLDGVPILQLPVPSIPADTNWYNFSVSFTATGACHTIGFASEINGTDVSYWIDNLHIECCTTNNCVSIKCPPDMNVLTCSNGAFVSYPLPTASSSCGTAIVGISCTPPSGSFFPVGVTPVVCTATDAQGNSASCNFLVVVRGDTTPPTCPPFNIKVTGCPPLMPNFQTNGLVTDNCTPSALLSVTQSIPAGTPLTPGTVTVVILTICDQAGNCRVCDVVVGAQASSPPPKLKCKDITITTCSNAAVVYYSQGVTGGTPPYTITYSPPSGSTFPVGTNFVTMTVKDACGYVVTCTFRVIVTFTISVNPNVTITAGLPDNFALPPDPAQTNACMKAAFGGFPFWKNFDVIASDRLFGHRMTNLPNNIVQAQLVIRMKPNPGDPNSDNDGLFIGLGSSCTLASFLYAQSIKTIPTATPPTGGTWKTPLNGSTTFTINLSSPAFLAKLNTDQYLDVVVHDDTAVDYMQLRLWTCPPKHVGIGIPFTAIGSARVTMRPDSDEPGDEGAALFVTPDPAEPDSGITLEPGTPEAMTFTTELPFDAPDGAELRMANQASSSGRPTYDPLLVFRKLGPSWDIKVNKRMFVSDSGNLRAVAIGRDGHLFSSLNIPGSDPDIPDLVKLTQMSNSASVRITLTIDCDTREVTLVIPECDWTPSSFRKGWDGCIYGNWNPPKGTAARLILQPGQPLVPRMRLGTVPMALLVTGLSDMPVVSPTVTSQGRKWGDGHVTLMKAYDDGDTQRVLNWTSFGDDGGVHVDLGQVSSFDVGIHHFEGGATPEGATQEQVFRFIGPPPRGLTNRPPPPNIPLRLLQQPGGTDVSFDFSAVGASDATIQLWRNGALVRTKNTVVGNLDTPGCTLSRVPERLGRPAINEGLFLRSSSPDEPFTVQFPGEPDITDCDDLRIIPNLPLRANPFEFVSGLELLASSGMEGMFYDLQRTLACTPGPITIDRAPDGSTSVSWSGSGFRLQGAETLTGPWYDLGVESPVRLSVRESFRWFRLICD